MQKLQFKAYSVASELDLNKIAVQCNIPKKYTWEEPLILQGSFLEKILEQEVTEDQKITLFSFGCIVFINIEHSLYEKFIDYLRVFRPEIELKTWNHYNDDYELRVGEEEEFTLTDKFVIVRHFEVFYPELIAIVIAKSVALEKVEFQLGKILDRIEGLIERLEKGKFRIGDRELAQTTASVARHEYNSINYIMILDKPDVTWINSEAADFYEQLSAFFELNDRYVILKSKTDILNNIINGFSSISHSISVLFVEWVIVILIVIEVILMVIELFR